MNGYPHADLWIELGKAKMRDFHQEREAARFVKEARNDADGRIGTEVILARFKRLIYRRKFSTFASDQ